MTGNTRPMKDTNGHLRIGSCFSGIGGIELGLEAAGLGRTVYQIEVDGFCRSQLARHWPDIPRFGDIAAVDPSALPQCDILCGGVPCQDASIANAKGNVSGKRAGLQGPRTGLWTHMAAIIETQRPDWVLVENVARGWRKWLPGVRGDLRGLGYASLPIPLEARLVGAPHVRSRIFLLAHAHGFAVREHEQRMPRRRPEGLRDGRQALALGNGGESRLGRHRGWEARPRFSTLDDGIPPKMGGRVYSAIGNAVVPQCAEVIGWMIRELEEEERP